MTWLKILFLWNRSPSTHSPDFSPIFAIASSIHSKSMVRQQCRRGKLTSTSAQGLTTVDLPLIPSSKCINHPQTPDRSSKSCPSNNPTCTIRRNISSTSPGSGSSSGAPPPYLATQPRLALPSPLPSTLLSSLPASARAPQRAALPMIPFCTPQIHASRSTMLAPVTATEITPGRLNDLREPGR